MIYKYSCTYILSGSSVCRDSLILHQVKQWAEEP